MEKYGLGPARIHALAKKLLRIHGRAVMMQTGRAYELLCQSFTDKADQWIVGFVDPIERACAKSLASGYDDYLDDKSGFYAFDAEAGDVRWFERAAVIVER